MSKIFQYTSFQQGIILSSFFVGYILTQLPGGWFATRYGGKWIYGIGVLFTAVLTLLTPIAAQIHIGLLITVRILEGIAEGVTYPAFHALLSKWAPPLERSRMASFAYGGGFAGTVIAFPASSAIASSTYFGWQWIFYIFGGIGVLWFLFWAILASNSPSEDKSISFQEKNYLMVSLPAQQKITKIPWKCILKNGPVWALIVTSGCSSWGFYTVLTWLPSYLQDILNFDLETAGPIEILPYVGIWLFAVLAGVFADLLIKNSVSVTAVRKIFQDITLIISAIALIATGYATTPVSAVALMTLAVSSMGFGISGIGTNQLDIFPEFAGIILGLSNTAGNVPGIISPSLTGWILGSQRTDIERWRIVFYISGGVDLFGAVIWTLFASGKKQKVYF